MTIRRLTSHPTARENERGQSMVEFAMVLPILCLLLFGIVQFGMAFWTYQQVSAAASEGARKAAISRTSLNRTTLTVDTVKSASPQLDPAKLNTSISTTWAAGSPVSVTVTYPLTLSVMGVTYYNGNLTGKRTMRVEQ